MRRGAVIGALIWALAAAWTLTASYTLSAERPLRTVGGVPHWVVWGVMAPWVTAFVVHVWYSVFYVGGEPED